MQLIIDGKRRTLQNLDAGTVWAIADSLCDQGGFRRVVVTETVICLEKV